MIQEREGESLITLSYDVHLAVYVQKHEAAFARIQELLLQSIVSSPCFSLCREKECTLGVL